MKICNTCGQLYTDESFLYCLHDGKTLEVLSNSETTQVLPSANSIVTVISNRLSPSDVSFEGKFTFDETETDGLSLKIISSDDDSVQLGFKIPLKNLVPQRRDIFVTVKAIDSDGFELEDFTLSGKFRPAEIRTLTDKRSIEVEIFNQIAEWKVEEITSYE